MNRSLLGAACVVALLAAHGADAKTVDGWLGQCSAVAAGSCTEQTAAGYLRQPVSFSALGGGKLVNATAFSYAQGVTGSLAGRGIYDAPTGGHLLMVLPFATPYTIPSIGDRGDVGSISASLTAFASFPNPDAFSGAFAAGAALGTTSDGSVVTAGTNLTVTRGVLAAFVGSNDAVPFQVTEVTGFSLAIPASTSSVDILGAGTLATGAISLPVAPVNGYIQRIECSVTVTALTLTAGAGSTLVGTAPTTCGPNASHEEQYFSANTSWVQLF